MVLDSQRHRFSVEDYHRLAQAGVLDEDDRVELIRGELIEMNPIGSAHAESLRRFTERWPGWWATVPSWPCMIPCDWWNPSPSRT